jgi:hypothetical protein
MAVTGFQRELCRLIAANRISLGTSYVADGVALNTLIQASRISRDIDIFHDTGEAVLAAWEADRRLLEARGYSVESTRTLPSFVEALVRKDRNAVVVQWARDSAYRFFPLVEDPTFGLTLHPFDLATNKVLAMAGRLNFGYLVWAACGKDPGFSPGSLIAEARRGGRYSAEEIALLSFEGPPPDAAVLGRNWHSMLKEAERIIGLLPASEVGTCVVDRTGELFRGNPPSLEAALSAGVLRFHHGTIHGAWPRIAGPPEAS